MSFLSSALSVSTTSLLEGASSRPSTTFARRLIFVATLCVSGLYILASRSPKTFSPNWGATACAGCGKAVMLQIIQLLMLHDTRSSPPPSR